MPVKFKEINALLSDNGIDVKTAKANLIVSKKAKEWLSFDWNAILKAPLMLAPQNRLASS